MEKTEKQFGVQKEILKLRTKKEYLALRKLSQLSKNMYNVGLYSVRQHFFETKNISVIRKITMHVNPMRTTN